MIKKSTAAVIVIVVSILVFVGTLTMTGSLYMITDFFKSEVSDNKGNLNYSKLKEIKNIIDKYYYEEDFENEKLIDGAAKGLVQALEDPYSSYMNKDEYQESIENVSNSYGGIGVLITVDTEDDLIKVISPFEGTPAAKAGILPGDKIIKVDGVEVSGKKLNKAVDLMKGPPGTEVTITLIRGSYDNVKELTIKRDIIKLAKIKTKTYEENIGYIRIPRFYDGCGKEFKEALNKHLDNGIKGLIIDVRNNPGGLVNEVSDIADRLVPKGVMISAKDKYGNKDSLYSDKQELEIPLVLLINQGSASASEILAITVKEYDKGILVGEKTFGKGVIQTVIPLSDGSGISITSAKYFDKNGNSYHEVGIEPDIKVKLDMNTIDDIYNMEYDEDLQLQEAIKILKNNIQ